MTEILTESFCERCGTRYTFESTAPRKSRLGRVRTLSKGVRNFVLSDDSSFSEALAEARSEEELAATSHQLDAFHQTFNFCLTCRQYTCGDCWNIAEGRCLTCAPLPGQEEGFSPIGLGALLPEAFEAAPSGNGHAPEDIGVEAWPEMDLPADRLARVLDLAPDTTAADAGAEGEAVAVAPLEPAAAPAEEFDVAPGTMLIGVAPGQSLDDAIAEYEARVAAEEAQAADEAEAAEAALEAQAAEAAHRAVLEAEAAEAALEAQAAEAAHRAVLEAEAAEAALEAQAAEAAHRAVLEAEAAQVALEAEAAEAAAEPEPVAPPPAPVDHVRQPTWPVPPQPAAPMQPPAAPGPTPSPWLTVAPDDSSAPQWPATPQWPAATARRDAPTGIAGRPFLPQADASALWAASNQEVLGAAPAPLPGAAAAPQAQPCVSCGLSLSANARFCRRCGTRQG
ncbi:MAG: hypothetical protein AB1627_02330 [Chloroflexota bacterium]